MLTNKDRQEIWQMIRTAKEELRHDMWTRDEDGHVDRVAIKSDVSDNTEAILELSELIPTEEV